MGYECERRESAVPAKLPCKLPVRGQITANKATGEHGNDQRTANTQDGIKHSVYAPVNFTQVGPELGPQFLLSCLNFGPQFLLSRLNFGSQLLLPCLKRDFQLFLAFLQFPLAFEQRAGGPLQPSYGPPYFGQLGRGRTWFSRS